MKHSGFDTFEMVFPETTCNMPMFFLSFESIIIDLKSTTKKYTHENNKM